MAFHPLPSLDADSTLLFLVQLGSLLFAAMTLGGVARRLNLPPIVGELLAGILLGPSVLGNVTSGWINPDNAAQIHLLDAVGLIAVILLVGLTGMHLDLRLLRRRRATVVTVSLSGLVVPLALGIGAGFLVPQALLAGHGDRVTFAFYLGVAMCVSAIPVIAKILTDMKLLHSSIGQLVLSASTVDDAAGWFLLSLVSAMAVNGLYVGSIVTSAVVMVGFVAVAWYVVRPVVNLAMKLASRSAESGPTVAIAAVVMLAGAAAGQALGLEPVFGAFLAGILIGSSPALDKQRLEPLQSVVIHLLAPIFLAIVGLRVNLRALGDPKVLAAGLAILAVAFFAKFAGAYAGARLSRLGHWEGVALGAGLNTRGVVEIVVATVGLRLGVLSSAMYTIIVMVALITSLSTPPLLRWAMSHLPTPVRVPPAESMILDDAIIAEQAEEPQVTEQLV